MKSSMGSHDVLSDYQRPDQILLAERIPAVPQAVSVALIERCVDERSRRSFMSHASRGGRACQSVCWEDD